MTAGLILEGVTGSGKSSTLAALRSLTGFQRIIEGGEIFPEEITFGSFMTESRDDPHSTVRLDTILNRIEHEVSVNTRYVYVLERFHFSYNTFARNWTIYEPIEKRLSALNCGVVLLTIPDEHMATRSLDRADMAETDWLAQMVAFFGSHEAALDGVRESAHLRREDVRKSILPSIEIDTSSSDWHAYAATALSYLSHLMESRRLGGTEPAG